ncbi:MAG TPA: hypothetical protein VK116_12350, partial [Planctomycetota bacterium]|nr:hypothetical protein [Planctomycetota bacterium]
SEPPSGLRARGLPRHTFRGIARLAERLREKVELPGAIFLFDDWLASGDASVPHPELFLAAAEECGGDEAFGACAERIHDLGYFVALALDREALVPHRAGTPIVGEVAWRLAELATRSPGGLSRIRDLASPDLLIVREPRGEGTAPQLLDARERFFAGANALVPLLGGNVPWDGDLDRLMWIEELLPTHQRGGLEELATMKPIFAALYQLSFRFAARPGEELAPSDAHRLLLHLLLAQPPVLEPPPELDSNGRALPPIEPSTGPEWRFAREGGFSEGRELSPHEIFIKTAAETAGYLAQYAAREPLVSFRALDDRGRVLESRFGFDLRVVVNFGPDPFTIEETGMVLPELGFWIQYPFFYAFHALAAEGVEYEEPALFTVRSLEGKLYLRAEKVRIWHGFGPAKIRLGGRDFTVERETEARIW